MCSDFTFWWRESDVHIQAADKTYVGFKYRCWYNRNNDSFGLGSKSLHSGRLASNFIAIVKKFWQKQSIFCYPETKNLSTWISWDDSF